LSEKKSITFFTYVSSSGYEKLKHGTYERLIIIIPRELRPLGGIVLKPPFLTPIFILKVIITKSHRG